MIKVTGTKEALLSELNACHIPNGDKLTMELYYEEACHFCKGNAVSEKGVIYVRYEVNGKWTNVPECKTCWELERHKQ